MKRIFAGDGFKRLMDKVRQRPPELPELAVYLPATQKNPGQVITDHLQLARHLRVFREGTVQLLQEINRYLDMLNRTDVAPDQRYRLISLCMKESSAIIAQIYRTYVEKGVSLPEEEQQREAVSACIYACEQLAMGYKHVYKNDRLVSARESPQARMMTCAVRIFELMRMMQWLRALRYQKLPTQVWKDCNHIFFDARFFLDVDEPQSLEICPRIRSPFSQDEAHEIIPAAAGIHQIYISIQLVGLLDASTWPAHLIHVVDAYLRSLEQPLRVAPDAGEILLDDSNVIIYGDQAGPPRFIREEGRAGNALLLNVDALRARLQEDMAALSRRQYGRRAGESAVDPLAVVADQNRLPVIELMLRKLQPQSRREERAHAYQVKYARVYCGFSDVFQLIETLAWRDPSRKSSFRDELARYSSTMQDAKSDGDMPRWLIVNESANGLQLRIRENRYTVSLYVGQLVSYNPSIDDINSLKIGYIVRLQRVDDDYVEIGIARLSDDGECVAVRKADSAQDGAAVSGLIIKDSAGRRQLLLGLHHGLKPGVRMAMAAEARKTETLTLGDLYMAKSDFTIFEIDRPQVSSMLNI